MNYESYQIKAAPFLVSASQDKDYTVIVTPEYLLENNLYLRLSDAVGDYNSPTKEGQVICIKIHRNLGRNLFLIFRSTWASSQYIGQQEDSPLRDNVGRKIAFIEGIVVKKEIIENCINVSNLTKAHNQVIEKYQEFWYSNKTHESSTQLDFPKSSTQLDFPKSSTQFDLISPDTRDKSNNIYLERVKLSSSGEKNFFNTYFGFDKKLVLIVLSIVGLSSLGFQWLSRVFFLEKSIKEVLIDEIEPQYLKIKQRVVFRGKYNLPKNYTICLSVTGSDGKSHIISNTKESRINIDQNKRTWTLTYNGFKSKGEKTINVSYGLNINDCNKNLGKNINSEKISSKKINIKF